MVPVVAIFDLVAQTSRLCERTLNRGCCLASFRTVSVSLMETNFSRLKLKDLDLRIHEDENDQENGMNFSNNRLENDKKLKRTKATPGNVLSHLLSNVSCLHCLELSRFAEFHTDVLTGSLMFPRWQLHDGKIYSKYVFMTCSRNSSAYF